MYNIMLCKRPSHYWLLVRAPPFGRSNTAGLLCSSTSCWANYFVIGGLRCHDVHVTSLQWGGHMPWVKSQKIWPLWVSEQDVTWHDNLSTAAHQIWTPQITQRENNRQTYNRWRTKYQNFNDHFFVLQLSLPNPLKPGAKSRMKM